MSLAPHFETAPGGLSKRAARRLIQRAFVLAGRDRNVRQHTREIELASVWVIEDWGLEWTVLIRRGRLEFERRPARNPDLRVAWATAEAFFGPIRGQSSTKTQCEYEGVAEARRVWETVYHAFRTALSDLLRNPVDEDGTSLV
jgi:hypothetical protein